MGEMASLADVTSASELVVFARLRFIEVIELIDCCLVDRRLLHHHTHRVWVHSLRLYHWSSALLSLDLERFNLMIQLSKISTYIHCEKQLTFNI